MNIVKVDICKYSMSLTVSDGLRSSEFACRQNNPLSQPAVPGPFHTFFVLHFSATTGAPELSQNAKIQVAPFHPQRKQTQVVALRLFCSSSQVLANLHVFNHVHWIAHFGLNSKGGAGGACDAEPKFHCQRSTTTTTRIRGFCDTSWRPKQGQTETSCLAASKQKLSCDPLAKLENHIRELSSH